ncbi:MAG TPA: hypothetical protein VMH04_13725 [Candidatus Solibacter sp.]|nr:hypothetical protein [Candidatus Solibacter sp.]
MPTYPHRCQHIKVNGTQCGSPALRRNRFCYFHKLHHDQRIELNADRAKKRRHVAIDLPVLEDANSIQVSLMQITRLLISGDIDTKVAGLILYALQTASGNLQRTRFEPLIHDVILDPSSVAETPLDARAWSDSDFEDEDESANDPSDGVDPARRAGVMKAAEFLYDLDKKNKGIHGFAPKPTPATAPKPVAKSKPDAKKIETKKVEAKTPEVRAAEVKTAEVKTAETKTEQAKPSESKMKKAPARELNPADVRQQLRQQILKEMPALLAANPSLLTRPTKESRDGSA